MEEIHVAYCSDNGYAPYLGVSLASILLNARVDEKLNVYIVNRGISSESSGKDCVIEADKRFFVVFF
jgi:lipopolysaccharide biosynthesis glycosyltransferase